MHLRSATSRDIPRLRKIEKAARTRYRSAGRLSFVAETPPIAASRLGFRPMPAALIGPSLRAVLQRHRRFLDMRTRVTVWRPIAGSDKGP
ncbi:MAG TPA: hypothetical protein VE993_19360 [Stellaceae bacterium]|nr:hypothetical protein [Stellaceae bacterium]